MQKQSTLTTIIITGIALFVLDQVPVLLPFLVIGLVISHIGFSILNGKKLEKLEQEKENLIARTHDLSRDLEEAESNFDELLYQNGIDYNRSLEDYNQLESDKFALEEKFAELNNQFIEKENELIKIKQELEVKSLMVKENEILKHNYEEVSKDSERMYNKIQELEEKITEQTIRATNYQGEQFVLAEENKFLNDQINKIQKEKDEYKEKLASVESKIDSLKENLQALISLNTNPQEEEKSKIEFRVNEISDDLI